MDLNDDVFEETVRAIVRGDVPYPYIRECVEPLRLFDFLKKTNMPVSFLPLDSKDPEFPAKLRASGYPGNGPDIRPDTGILFQGAPTEYLTFIQPKRIYLKGDIITDYFAEEERVKCSVQGKGAPITLWNKEENVRKWLLLCMRRCGYLNTFTMREAIFESFLYKECNQYKPLLVKTLIQMTGAKRVLDLSSGWGDRLIGSLAAGVDEYLGCDPNGDLQKVYTEIIRMLCPQGTKARVVQSKAEDMDVPEGRFDLFHSSPPFWVKEEYQGMDLSISLDDWIQSFLYRYLEQGMKGLKRGGWFIIYINDYGKVRYVHAMNTKLREMGHRYHGMMGSGGDSGKGTMNSLWVWSKI